MANHNLPTLTSTYANFVTELDARIDDVSIQFDPALTTATNQATGTVRWTSASNKWEKWSGTAWGDLASTYAISISGNATTVTNGVYTTGTYADPTWITSLAGTKITGSIAGNSGTATKLATSRNINGVAFDGSASISINLNSLITFNNAGNGAASGSTFNGSAAVSISYNSIGAAAATGGNASGTWGISITGNAATATTAASCTSAGKIANTGGWNITPSGTKLYFNYNGTNVGSLDSSGNFTVTGNVAAFGTIT